MQDTTRRENIYERDKLFQEIWSVPMLQLARRYGVSNNGLKNVCKKLDIPVPPRGYWAKVHAGKKVNRPCLSSCKVTSVGGNRTMPPSAEFSDYGTATIQYRQREIAQLEDKIEAFEFPPYPSISDAYSQGEQLKFLDNKAADCICKMVEKMQIRQCVNIHHRKTTIMNRLSRAAEEIGGKFTVSPPIPLWDIDRKLYGRSCQYHRYDYFVFMDTYIRVQLKDGYENPLTCVLSCYYKCEVFNRSNYEHKPPLEKVLIWTDVPECTLEMRIGEIFKELVTLAGWIVVTRQRDLDLQQFRSARTQRVTAPSLPLKAYEDLKAFKLFLLDVGLLSCMVELRQDTLLDGNGLFKEFKGALTEQYVLQQLKTIKNINTYYWAADRGTAEVDFVIDNGSDVIPIEVKAEANLQAKSLKVYREKFKPKVCIRTAMVDYKKEDWLVNLPLWAVSIDLT